NPRGASLRPTLASGEDRNVLLAHPVAPGGTAAPDSRVGRGSQLRAARRLRRRDGGCARLSRRARIATAVPSSPPPHVRPLRPTLASGEDRNQRSSLRTYGAEPWLRPTLASGEDRNHYRRSQVVAPQKSCARLSRRARIATSSSGSSPHRCW